MPGVLIIEAMAQVGGVMAYTSLEESEEGKLIYFMGIDKARFRRRVVPGDQLIFEMTLLKKRAGLFKMAGKATVEGVLAAEAEVMAMTGDE